MIHVNADFLVFSFPEVHPYARLTVRVHRTLRLPVDGARRGLPPPMGALPLAPAIGRVGRLSPQVAHFGGAVAGCREGEALYLDFQPHKAYDRPAPYPFAVKVAAGGRSAVTARPLEAGLRAGDYLTVPPQPWLDGYATEKGTILQFVAAGLGKGLTVEEQLDGAADFGGLQLEVIPMPGPEYDRRHPARPEPTYRGATRGGGLESMTYGGVLRGMSAGADGREAALGMAAGGRMEQRIEPDPYGLEAWAPSLGAAELLFLHVAGEPAWLAAGGPALPAPLTRRDYLSRGFAWPFGDGDALGGEGPDLGRIKPLGAP